MIKSRSFGDIFATSNAFFDALRPNDAVVSVLSAIYLCLMPVLDSIHSSVVSTISDSSWFDTTFLGTEVPHPMI